MLQKITTVYIQTDNEADDLLNIAANTISIIG